MNDKRLWFTHKCRICSYMFTSEKDLLLHESTHEKDDTRQQHLSCRSCSMSFDSNKQLTEHVCMASATDGPRTIQQQRMCKACGDLFATTNELYMHYVSRHLEHDTNNKANKSDEVVSAKVCVECGAVFSCWASYKVHLWKAHTGSISSSSCAASVVETDLFKMNGSAAESFHEKAKTSEKPFKCSLCNWAFKYDFSLHSHMKVHERKQEELMQLLQNSESQSEPLSASVIDPSTGESVNAKPNESSAEVYKPVVFIRIKHDSGRPSGSELSTDGTSSGNEIACGDDTSHISHRLGSKKIKLDTIADSETIPDNCVIGQELVTVDEDGTQNILSVIASATKSTGSDTGCDTYAATTPPVGDEQVQQQPHRFVCKLCNFSCQYDFSYIAHLNQHSKLRELQIDDLQSHLIATETNVVAATRPHLMGPHLQIVRPHQPSLPASGKFSLGLVDDSGSVVTYIKASHLLPTAAGTNYILLSGDAVDGDVTGHCSDDDDLREAVTSTAEQEQRHHQQQQRRRRRRRSIDDDVVLVDGSSAINMVDIGSQSSSPGTNYEIDDGPSHGGESSFVMALDSVIGEAYYVISEGDMRDKSDTEGGTSQHFVVMPSTDEHCDVVVVSEDVVVGGTVADDVIQSSHDDTSDICDTHTCYFCNASFTCKASLQQHIQLHVE